MNQLIGVMWGIIGIICVFAARPFAEVFGCFLLYGIFEGIVELHEIRKEISAKELEKIIKGAIKDDEQSNTSICIRTEEGGEKEGGKEK